MIVAIILAWAFALIVTLAGAGFLLLIFFAHGMAQSHRSAWEADRGPIIASLGAFMVGLALMAGLVWL